MTRIRAYISGLTVDEANKKEFILLVTTAVSVVNELNNTCAVIMDKFDAKLIHIKFIENLGRYIYRKKSCSITRTRKFNT